MEEKTDLHLTFRFAQTALQDPKNKGEKHLNALKEAMKQMAELGYTFLLKCGETADKINIKRRTMEPQKKYLYGASIQGIQKFIFETSKLREIAGNSEIEV